jgi:repressor LexA
MEQLTDRQRLVYEFIREKILDRGYGPTVREIGDHFQIRSPNGVMCHLKALEKKELIQREPNMSRAIRLSEPLHHSGLPVKGRIAAGVLHEAIEREEEEVDFTELFNNDRRDLFVLEVDGDSMIEAQIASGDYVVVRRQSRAERGQIVVARTDDGEATLKRWYPERGRIRLEPANAKMKPIYVKNATIMGVVVGVIRKVR